MPKPIAKRPVHTSSFHHESFSTVILKKKKKFTINLINVINSRDLPKILQADTAEASSGISPAPTRNTPNTKNTTPIWSIPIDVTTCVTHKNYKFNGFTCVLRDDRIMKHIPLYRKMWVDDSHAVVGIFVWSNFVASAVCPHFLNFVCYIGALAISWPPLCVVVVVWWPGPSEFPWNAFLRWYLWSFLWGMTANFLYQHIISKWRFLLSF